MHELERYLKSYFSINQEDLSKINSLFKPEELKKGDFYVKQGAYCKKLSFVRKGLIRVYKSSPEKDVTQWISTEGYFIADLISFIFYEASRWNIQALTDCELYTISLENYQKMGQLVPNWYELEKRFITKCFGTLEDRVFSFISMSAEERYNQLFENNPELFNQVSLQYLASMLGMTPETLSRIRAKRIS